jgi:tetratricopeptide (TPR) repeat protein
VELNQQDPKDLDSAIDLYQNAIKVEKTFSLAHVGLARCYLSQFRISGDSKLLQKALVTAQQSVQLDDDLPDAHRALGEIYKSAKNKEESLLELNRVAELEPNSDLAYRDLGSGGGRCGSGCQEADSFISLLRSGSALPVGRIFRVRRGDTYQTLSRHSLCRSGWE